MTNVDSILFVRMKIKYFWYVQNISNYMYFNIHSLNCIFACPLSSTSSAAGSTAWSSNIISSEDSRIAGSSLFADGSNNILCLSLGRGESLTESRELLKYVTRFTTLIACDFLFRGRGEDHWPRLQGKYTRDIGGPSCRETWPVISNSSPALSVLSPSSSLLTD